MGPCEVGADRQTVRGGRVYIIAVQEGLLFFVGWLSPLNPTYLTGIYTLYILPLTFFIHLPMKMEPIRSSETAVKTQTPGNYPKKEHITKEIIVVDQ